MNPYLVGLFIPLIASLILRKSNAGKKRGLPANAGGEPGYAIRNYRSTSPVESNWQGVSTLAELFEHSCKRFMYKPLLGSRKLIAREMEVSQDGRSFEKLHLGNYEWISYGQAFKTVCNFASGLVQVGHKKDERVAIFSDTRAEWLIAAQACFRQNITVVTIYASLGQEALCHSLNETEVSTVICGHKELKKLVDICGQLDTVKRVIYIDEEGASTEVSLAKKNSNWMITSFVEVEAIGKEKPVDADLPLSADIAVIMYTSGSTGLPKGVMMTHGNVLAMVSAVMTIVPSIGTKDIYMAYLPLAHILELAAESVMVAAGTSIGYGSPLTLTDTSNKIKRGTKGDASVLRPTLMTAVPAILDRVRDGVRKKVDAKGGLSKKLFDTAYGRRLAAVNGSWFGAWGLEKVFWDLLVFKKVREVLGGRIRFLLSGGAPLSGDTQRFINICIGAPIGQGYGLTETCAGGTFSEYDDTSVGRVGAPLPCSYVKGMDETRNQLLQSHDGSSTCKDFLNVVRIWLNKLKLSESLRCVFGETNQSELAAFSSYALAFPNNFLALVDTYDVMKSGIPNFCAVALALHDMGYKASGIRLDSGDLAYQSMEARKVFRAIEKEFNIPGFGKMTITASNDLNEETLDALKKQGHEIDAFGIGTHLVTCYAQAALGCVYKLVEINNQPRIKISEDVGKLSIPCKKRCFRLYGKEGNALVDIMIGENEPSPKVGERILCRHPCNESKRAYVVPQRVEELLKCYWPGSKNKPREELPSLEKIRAHCMRQLEQIRPDHLRRLNPTPYKVSVSGNLYGFIHFLWLNEAPVGELQ